MVLTKSCHCSKPPPKSIRELQVFQSLQIPHITIALVQNAWILQLSMGKVLVFVETSVLPSRAVSHLK